MSMSRAVGAEQAALVEVEPAGAEGDAARGRRRAGRRGRRCRGSGRRGGRLGAAQHRAHPGQQLAHLERLGQVVVGAELEADDAVDRLARGRQHHQADARMRLAQPARQRQAVLAGHVDVEDGQRRRLHRPPRARAAAASAAVSHGEAVAAEVLGEQRAQLGLVVDDQHHRAGAAFGLGHCSLPGKQGWRRVYRARDMSKDTFDAHGMVQTGASVGGQPVSNSAARFAKAPWRVTATDRQHFVLVAAAESKPGRNRGHPRRSCAKLQCCSRRRMNSPTRPIPNQRPGAWLGHRRNRRRITGPRRHARTAGFHDRVSRQPGADAGVVLIVEEIIVVSVDVVAEVEIVDAALAFVDLLVSRCLSRFSCSRTRSNTHPTSWR